MANFVVDEAHLLSLLMGAKDLSLKTDLRSRRMAAFLLVEYYDNIFREAAATIGLTLGGATAPESADKLLASIPFLVDLEFLRGLRHVRHPLAHDITFNPSQRQLDLYLDKAEAVREALTKGAKDQAQRLTHMSIVSQRLVKASQELNAVIPTLARSHQPPWREKALRAQELANGNPASFSAEMVDLLVDIRTYIVALEAETAILEPHREPEPEPEPDYYQREYEPDYEPPDGYDPEAGYDQPPEDEREPPEDEREPPEDEREPRTS